MFATLILTQLLVASMLNCSDLFRFGKYVFKNNRFLSYNLSGFYERKRKKLLKNSSFYLVMA